ncbi:MAG: methyltransferase [Verrucomicrobia bacterium]|nr:methyltransferase [Verrucomicrobiota bacterium]
MTSRERVLRCLERNHPDRPPRHTWWLPIAELEHGHEAIRAFKDQWPDDIAMPGVPVPALQALRQGDPYAAGGYVDEWGCEFENLQPGIIGEVKNPMLEDWSRLGDLKLPEACLTVDVAAVNAACRASDKFLLSDAFPRPFERLQFLRGAENVYMDLGEDSPELRGLLARVHDLYRRELELWATTDVDGLVFIDDWGSQDRLLISPAQWREWFKPLYRDYIDIAHAAGKKCFMHSDGNISAIYEDLIEIGLDAVNSQLFCMDIGEIGRRHKGRIAFWGEIDRQRILPYGSEDDARAAVRRVAEALYDPAGGVIAQFEFGAACRLQNAHAVHDEWLRIATRQS